MVTPLHLLANSWTFSPFSDAGNYNVNDLRGVSDWCPLRVEWRTAAQTWRRSKSRRTNGPSEGHKTKPFAIFNNISAWCRAVSTSKHQAMKLTNDMGVKTQWQIPRRLQVEPCLCRSSVCTTWDPPILKAKSTFQNRAHLSLSTGSQMHSGVLVPRGRT